MDKYTSLKLSKLLAENNCELESKKMWFNGELVLVGKNLNKNALIYSYDILNDICVKYVKEFFGEEILGRETAMYKRSTFILLMLQTGIKQERVESYIWKHCLFNEKNK